MFSIAKKRVIVTGGSRGIGAAVVRVLVGQGARVAVFDVLDQEGNKLAADLSHSGPGKAHYFHVDVSNRQTVFDSVNKATTTLGGLDSLLNIAGIERSFAAEEVPEKALDSMLGVNLKGTFFTAQAAFPHLKEKGGSIINFGSGAAVHAMLNGSAYAMSKGAVHSLTRNLALEWGQYGIRINSVLPAIRTPMYEELRAQMTREQLAEHDADIKRRMPLGGKLGDAEADLAPAIAFLVSDASKFITGQMLPVDGGIAPVR